MTPEIRERVVEVLKGLYPTLDPAGFHITRIEMAGQRLRLGYNEPVDAIPPILVSAIAAVTRTDVDFVHGGTVSIASLVENTSAEFKPTKSIEELLLADDIYSPKRATMPRSGIIRSCRGKVSPLRSRLCSSGSQ